MHITVSLLISQLKASRSPKKSNATAGGGSGKGFKSAEFIKVGVQCAWVIITNVEPNCQNCSFYSSVKSGLVLASYKMSPLHRTVEVTVMMTRKVKVTRMLMKRMQARMRRRRMEMQARGKRRMFLHLAVRRRVIEKVLGR